MGGERRGVREYGGERRRVREYGRGDAWEYED
jgi:hypothetical protein